MAFVRVSGYGQDEIDNARKEGKALFVDEAICRGQNVSPAPYDTVITHEGVEVPLNTESPIFTNRTFAQDSIVVFSYTSSDANPNSSHPWLDITLTTVSGQCQRINTTYCAYYPSSNTYELAGNVFIYKVKAGATLTATIHTRDRKMRVTGGFYVIHTPAEA